MLGHLHHQHLGQDTTRRPSKAYPHGPMSLPPPTTPTATPPYYANTSSAAMKPYWTMACGPPPANDQFHSANLVDFSDPGAGRTAKVEERYMTPHYGYGPTQAATYGSLAMTTTAEGDVTATVKYTMAHAMVGGPQVLDILPVDIMEQNATEPAPAPVPQAQCKVPIKKRAVPVPEERKDEQYWDKRKKNNESAKRSREQRRIKGEKIAQKFAFLADENLKLRAQIEVLQAHIEDLRHMVYSP